MCGLPVNLSYDQVVQLTFNLDKIRWLKIDDMVQAQRIASGRTGPPEYYRAIAGDADEAAKVMGQELLTKMMAAQ